MEIAYFVISGICIIAFFYFSARRLKMYYALKKIKKFNQTFRLYFSDPEEAVVFRKNLAFLLNNQKTGYFTYELIISMVIIKDFLSCIIRKPVTIENIHNSLERAGYTYNFFNENTKLIGYSRLSQLRMIWEIPSNGILAKLYKQDDLKDYVNAIVRDLKEVGLTVPYTGVVIERINKLSYIEQCFGSNNIYTQILQDFENEVVQMIHLTIKSGINVGDLKTLQVALEKHNSTNINYNNLVNDINSRIVEAERAFIVSPVTP